MERSIKKWMVEQSRGKIEGKKGKIQNEGREARRRWLRIFSGGGVVCVWWLCFRGAFHCHLDIASFVSSPRLIWFSCLFSPPLCHPLSVLNFPCHPFRWLANNFPSAKYYIIFPFVGQIQQDAI